MHDIGKVVVPAEVLAKPGPLDEEEWNIVRDGRRGVVVSTPADALDKACVRIGWDAEGRPVDHYEVQLDSLP